MLHPVGHQSPSVYWRRRLVLLASGLALLALLAITAHVLMSKGGGTPSAAAPAPHRSTTPPPTPTPTPRTSTPGASSSSASTSVAASAGGSASGAGAGSAASSPGASSGSTAAAAACTSKQLSVSAVTSKPTYSVGQQPVLTMQVSNNGPLPCVQNLADSQVVLRVYNGVSRVWGSHDCEIQPGVDKRTLGVRMPVRISVVWSGLSAQPDCAGTRQRVGAGTYTLYVTLAGKDGTAAQFAIN